MTTFDEGALPPLRLSRSLGAVAAGGAVGTFLRTEILNWTDNASHLSEHALRTLLSLGHWTTNSTAHVPWGLLTINTVGVFFAAWLLSGPLRGRSPDDPWRLFAITGILGGLTSYSGLIRDLAAIYSHSALAAGTTLIGAVALGVCAAALGVRTGQG